MSKYIYTNSEHCPDYLTPGKLYETQGIFDDGMRDIVDDKGTTIHIYVPSSSHQEYDPFHVLPDFYDPEYSGNINEGTYKLYGVK